MKAVMMGSVRACGWTLPACLVLSAESGPSDSLDGMGGCCPHLSPVPAGISPQGYLYYGLGGHSRAVR